MIVQLSDVCMSLIIFYNVFKEDFKVKKNLICTTNIHTLSKVCQNSVSYSQKNVTYS